MEKERLLRENYEDIKGFLPKALVKETKNFGIK